MEGSEKPENKQKKITEVKTFSVPFAAEEINNNISISTNNTSKPSREQIINQAFEFHSRGNIPEAVKYYLQFINRGFKDHRIFSNYGAILKSEGYLEKAKTYYYKAITLKPDFTKAYYNLGILLNELNNFKEAEILTRKAISLDPDFSEAYSMLGAILKNLGKSEQALESYLKAIKINRSIINNYELLTYFLRDSDLSSMNRSQLNIALNILLETKNINHNELFKVFIFLYKNKIIIDLEEIESDLSRIKSFINDEVLKKALKKIIFKNSQLENILTKIRKNMCLRIAKYEKITNISEIQFVIALGEQCFLNEYIYSSTNEEKISIKKIINRCKDKETNEIDISILSCYIPLYKLLNKIPTLKSFNSYNQSLIELLKLQINEPLKEIELAKDIKSLGSIKDTISQKVKSQYEENPYPRWRQTFNLGNQKKSIVQAINNEIRPNSIILNDDNRQLEVLIAGCGTGYQIVQSLIYKNAKITGIDLSLSSLSYAQRKINELGIDNVELIQMDILEAILLEKEFDIIECGGVLHHMKVPSKGLKALLEVLKPNGFLKLGLYSELSRQDVIKAKKHITRKNLQPTITDIQIFREDVKSGNFHEIENIKKRASFYSISECRDLCFHTQEHRFTIKQLQETLKSHELKFLGFLLPQPVKSLYKKCFPEDIEQINLKNWEKYEDKHPSTFRGMYQFWVCKL